MRHFMEITDYTSCKNEEMFNCSLSPINIGNEHVNDSNDQCNLPVEMPEDDADDKSYYGCMLVGENDISNAINMRKSSPKNASIVSEFDTINIDKIPSSTSDSMEENDDSFSGSETEKIKKNNSSVNPDLEDTRRDETNTNPPVEITGIENIAAHSKVSPDEEFIPVEINAIHQENIALESKHFDGLLPLGTRNMNNKKYERKSYNDCTYREGTFDLTKQEFRSIYDNKKVIRGRYAFVLDKKIKSVNNTCVLYFKHSRTSRDFNHVGKLSHQLRSIERKMVKNKLLSCKPLEQRQNNGMEFRDYINLTYDCLVHSRAFPEKKLKIQICCFHMFKIICQDINIHFTTPESKQSVREILAAATNLKTWDSLREWFTHFHVVLNSKTRTAEFEESWQSLLVVCCNDVISNLQTSSTKTREVDIIPAAEEHTSYESSKFFKFFREISGSRHLTDDNIFEENPYYNPSFFGVVLKKYIPFASLWSGLLLIHSERLSNAPAERWFGVLKNILMDKNMSQKCSRVVRKLRKYTLFVCKKANLKIPKSKRNGKTMSVDESTPDLASQEIWQKKNKSIKNIFFAKHTE
ncbi:hypothetical protein JTB14_012867 [Gonioctena quinquepunctata]|nr:hypothetical protein JTB14_012867 [Gonioctena quinquepunctata]